MPTPIRPYILTNRADPGDIRIIKAPSQPAALAYAAQCEWSVRLATHDDLIEYLPAGIEVETAGEAPTARVTDSYPDPEPGGHDPAGKAPGEL